MATSLLTIDLQLDFFDPQSHPDAGRLAKAVCLPGVRALIAHARRHNWSIVHAITVHTSVQTLPLHLRKRGVGLFCEEGTEGVGLVPGLYEPPDRIIKKQSFDAFLRTELDNVLEHSDDLVICGVAADCCILLTSNSASNKSGKQVFLPYQAIAASSVGDYVFGLRAAAKSLATVVDLKKLLATEGQAPQLTGTPEVNFQNVEETCGSWFKSQQAGLERLRENGRLNSSSVTEILARVEAQLASEQGRT